MNFPALPPISTEVPGWSLPEVWQHQLDWGLRLMVVRVGHLPMMHARFLFRRGRVLEDPRLPGSARLMRSLTRHGTEAYDSLGLARALDQRGLRLRIAMGLDSSSVSMTCLSEFQREGMEILDEVLLRPTFPESHLKRERAKALDIHRQEVSSPSFLAGAWMSRDLYPGHAYGRSAVTGDGLAATTREDIQALYRSIFQPSQGVLMVVGDLDPERTLAQLVDRYSTPSGSLAALRAVPQVAPAGPAQCLAIRREESEQVRIQVGYRLFRRDSPEFYALGLLNRVLGGGASSRLFMELRERQGLTYGAYSGLDLGRYGGDMVATLDCSPDKASRALASLEHQLSRVRDEPIPPEELAQALRSKVGAFPQRASGLGGIAGLLSQRWSHSLPDDVWERYLENLAAVQVSDVTAVARKWLIPERQHLLLVGPKAALQQSLEGREGVHWVDAEDRGWMNGNATGG